MISSPFDELAANYDRSFSDTLLGRLLRQAVWRRLEHCFQSGQHILELNCGSGEDALHLARLGVRVLATDGSPAMVAATRAKVTDAGYETLVETRRLLVEELSAVRLGPFDGALSNFGGLNCVAELGPVAEGLARCLRAGAVAVLCLMGPFVPWEWAWFSSRGEFGKAFRRLRACEATWRGITVHYPSIRTARRAFAPWFRSRRVSALGALVPPPYAEAWARRHPKLLAWLDRWERRAEAFPGLAWLADHYLLELERQ